MSGMDFGEQSGGYDEKTEDYEKMSGTDFEYGSKITGEPYMTDKKTHEQYGDSFILVITNHTEEEIYFVRISPSFVEDGTVLYGKKGSKAYEILDPILAEVNKDDGEKPGEAAYRSVNFETFREAFNKNVKTITLEAFESTNALAKAAMNPLWKVDNFEMMV